MLGSMSLQTYTATRKNYKDLAGTAAPKPTMNFALDALKPQKSSIRFDDYYITGSFWIY